MRVLFLSFLAVLGLADSLSPGMEFLTSFGMSQEEITNFIREDAEKLGTVVKPFEKLGAYPTKEIGTGSTTLPLVFMHGMGDSCYNSGMKQITKLAGEHIGVYSVCIPTGNRMTDTTNGFFMTMNDNVDEWAKRVKADIHLAKGFHAVGFSQGNSVIRGYIQKYNDPPVSTFLSVHGTINGVAGFPNCDPDGLLGPVCKLIAQFCGVLAYSPMVQNMLFQADYFRDPKRYHDDAYLSNSEIAQWNNENPANVNNTYKENFESLKAMAMIKAEKDTMVFPNEGEWWGQFKEGSLKKEDILTMKDTPNYKSNSFGLQTLDTANKLTFNTTAGNHLQFSQEELYYWLDHYLVD